MAIKLSSSKERSRDAGQQHRQRLICFILTGCTIAWSMILVLHSQSQRQQTPYDNEHLTHLPSRRRQQVGHRQRDYYYYHYDEASIRPIWSKSHHLQNAVPPPSRWIWRDDIEDKSYHLRQRRNSTTTSIKDWRPNMKLQDGRYYNDDHD
jgi:hypothetical protein